MGGAFPTLSKEAAIQVSKDELDKIRATYVAPPPYAEAQHLLVERHVLVLYGYAHWGKRTTGLHLLSVLGDGSVSLVDPTTAIDPTHFSSATAYLVDGFWPQHASTLTAHMLARLSAILENRRAYLVITVDRSIALPEDTLSDYIVDWNTVPDPAEMLVRHCLWRGMSRDHLSSLTQSFEIQDVVHRHLLPGELEQLAIELMRVVRGGPGGGLAAGRRR